MSMKQAKTNRDEKIRVLFILPRPSHGGAEMQMIHLLRKLDRSRFMPFLGFLYPEGKLRPAFESIPGIRIIDFMKKGGLDLAVHWRIARFIRDERIGVVQTFLANHHAYIPAVIAGRCAAIGGIRDTFMRESSLIKRLTQFHIPKILSKKSRLIMVSNSNEAKKIYLAKGFSDSTVLVIPNGIDTEIFSKGSPAKIKKELKLSGRLIITIVGRLIPTKNHVLFIREFRRLAQAHRNAVLLIVGEGPERGNIEEEISALGLNGSVIMAGNRDDIPDILSATDIFAFPSDSEGWPNVIGEAMTAGVAVASYSAGDIPGIITDGKDGLLAGGMAELAAKVETLMASKAMRLRLGRAARQSVRKKFSVERMVRSYEEIYEKEARRAGAGK